MTASPGNVPFAMLTEEDGSNHEALVADLTFMHSLEAFFNSMNSTNTSKRSPSCRNFCGELASRKRVFPQTPSSSP